MARTVEVTKIGVTANQVGMNRVTLQLKYLEDAQELFIKQYSEDHKAGQAPSIVVDKFDVRMQRDIDFYKQAEAVSNHAQMDTAITNLQSALEA